MSKKKGLGKFVAFASIAGAAAAGISYLLKYKSFNKELDEDFRDFEDDDDTIPDSTMNRNYVSLSADKDELLVAAGDMLSAAKDVAGATKNVVKDAAAIVKDTALDAVSAAADTAAGIKNSAVVEDDLDEYDIDDSKSSDADEETAADAPEEEAPAETAPETPEEDAPKTEIASEDAATVSEDTETPQS